MLFVDELQYVPLVDLNNQQVDCEWTPPPLPLPQTRIHQINSTFK